jgi:hypothetical protein
MGPYKYWAFISYSHKDRHWADWLHRRLERFRIPRVVRSNLPTGLKRKSLSPIFIDHAELPAGHSLSQAIISSLDASYFLIVVASPAAARSKHVAQEVEYFIRQHSRERILTIIVAGRPNATARGFSSEEECFPAEITSPELPSASVIPIGADARGGNGKRIQALRRIAAGMLGVSYEKIYRRDLRRRALQISASIAAALAICVLVVPYGQFVHLGQVALGLVSQTLPQPLRGESDHWVGTWSGAISSTCGNYSGPITYAIAVAGPKHIRVTYNAGGMITGSYTLAYTGNEAISTEMPGYIYYSLAGKTITINYPQTCQTAKLTRQ